LLLVRPLEPELRNVGARWNLGLADDEDVEAVGDDLPEGLVRVDVRPRLIDVRDLHRLTDLEITAVERLKADDRLEERRLADAVRADDADDAVRREGEREVVEEHPVAE